MIESIFLWPYFGLTCMIIMWCSVTYGWLQQQKKWRAENAALRTELGDAQRTSLRLFESVHVLLRAFHIRPQDNPYVVERLDNGAINDQFVTCFHCKRTRFAGHAPNCVWDFVAKNFAYAPDGALHVKRESK